MTKFTLFIRDSQIRLVICDKDIKEYFVHKDTKVSSLNDFSKIINNAKNKIYAFKELSYEEYDYFSKFNCDYIKYSLESYENIK